MIEILVVDDDFLIRKWLCLLLQKSSVCETKILQAENGSDALEVLKGTSIDLVVTDIKMPVMDGIELVQRIKSLYPQIQIAVLSAHDDYNYVRAMLKEGILDYLLKGELELKDIDGLLKLAEKQAIPQSSEPFPEKETNLANGYKDRIGTLLKEKKIDGAGRVVDEFLEQGVTHAINHQCYINTCISICYLFSNYLPVSAGRNYPAVEDTVLQILHAQNSAELSNVMRRFVDKILEALSYSNRYSATIEKSLAFIEANFSDKLSLEQVSSHVFLNKSYFSELFKKETGINFNDYLNQIRIQKACDLLIQNKYSLCQVAQMAGFSDQNYFSKIFKKITGTSPKAFKNSIY